MSFNTTTRRSLFFTNLPGISKYQMSSSRHTSHCQRNLQTSCSLQPVLTLKRHMSRLNSGSSLNKTVCSSHDIGPTSCFRFSPNAFASSSSIKGIQFQEGIKGFPPTPRHRFTALLPMMFRTALGESLCYFHRIPCRPHSMAMTQCMKPSALYNERLP